MPDDEDECHARDHEGPAPAGATTIRTWYDWTARVIQDPRASGYDGETMARLQPSSSVNEQIPGSDAEDRVMQEIVRVARLIARDKKLGRQECSEMLQRLRIEREAYAEWLRRYASYFTTPQRWRPPTPPQPPGSVNLPAITASVEDPARLPEVHVYADFGGYTHGVRYPADRKSDPGKYPLEHELVPSYLYPFMMDWVDEFSRYAWDDSMAESKKPGTMLWIAFDIRGMDIAHALKRHVGDAARVFYGKPVEDPFHTIETDREVLDSGEVRVL